MPERDVDGIIKRFEDLKVQRATWDTHWQEIAELVWPAADEFFSVKREPGEKRQQKVYDATAQLSLEKFAAVLESMLTPRAQQWHKLRASDEDLNKNASVKAWFEEVNALLFRMRNRPEAAYYSQKHEGYKSLGAFGNDCLFIDELEGGGIRYKFCHIGQVYIQTNHHGQVDTIYRLYEMTAKAAEQQWGSALPEKIANALKEHPWRKFEFLHCVMPRPEADPERMDSEGMPWVSLYIGVQDKRVIEDSGYHEMPYMYSRYTVNPIEMYGRSPSMMVLPAIKMVQEMQKTFIRAGHKVVDPPLLVHNESTLGLGSKRVRLKPGGVNYGGVDSRGKPLVLPLNTGARLDLTEGMLEKEREVIKEAFLVPLFRIFADENQKITATEVLVRAQEKGQQLAPVVGRQQSEMLGPQIEREVNILDRQGLLPELPTALIEARGEYEIEYETDAMRFQRSGQLSGTDRTLERAMALAAFDPSAIRILKADEVIRLSAEIEGAPSKILRTPEELEEVEAAAAEAEQAQAQLEQGAQAAAAAKDLAQAQAAAGPQGGVPVTP
jgi:hypothetical protein